MFVAAGVAIVPLAGPIPGQAWDADDIPGKGPPHPRARVRRFNNKARETEAAGTGLGGYAADLRTEAVAPGEVVAFTFHWTAAGRWEGTDCPIAVGREDAP